MSKSIYLSFKKLELDDKILNTHGDNINSVFVSNKDFSGLEFKDNQNLHGSILKNGIVKKFRIVVLDNIKKGEARCNEEIAKYINGDIYSLDNKFFDKLYKTTVQKLDNSKSLAPLEIELELSVSLEMYNEASEVHVTKVISTESKKPEFTNKKEDEYNSSEEDNDYDYNDPFINDEDLSDKEDSDEDFQDIDYYASDYESDATIGTESESEYNPDVIGFNGNNILNLNLILPQSKQNKDLEKYKLSEKDIIDKIKKSISNTPVEIGYKFVIAIPDKIYTNTPNENLFLTCEITNLKSTESSKLMVINENTKITPFVERNYLGSLIKINKNEEQKLKNKQDITDKPRIQPPLDYLSNNWEKYGVAGLEKQINIINEQVLCTYLHTKEELDLYDSKPVKGVLFYGLPGTGKTLLFKAIAGQLQEGLEKRKANNSARKIKTKTVRIDDVKDMYVGESARKIREEIFKEAEDDWKKRKEDSDIYMFFLDECEAYLGKRTEKDSENGYMKETVDAFLQIMDSSGPENIILFFVTNRPGDLDDAIVRSQRVNVKVEFTLPDLVARKKIFNLIASKLQKEDLLEDDINADYVASVTKGFSGADLRAVFESAKRKSIFKNVISDKEKNILYKDPEAELAKVSQPNINLAIREVMQAQRPHLAKFYRIAKNPFVWYSDEMDETYKKICKNIDVLKNNKLLTLGVFGDSGTGKTSLAVKLAQRIQNKYDFDIQMVQSQDFHSNTYYGVIAKMDQVFREAQDKKKGIVVIDDIDKIVGDNEVLQDYFDKKMQDSDDMPNDCQLIVIITGNKARFCKHFEEDACVCDFNLKKIDNISQIKKVIDAHGLKVPDSSGTVAPKSIRKWVRIAKNNAIDEGKLQSRASDTKKRSLVDVITEGESFENPKKKKNLTYFL